MNAFDRARFQKAGMTGWALALAAVATTAQAQDTSTSAGEVGKTEEEIIVQAGRAVTATKTDTPLMQIPQSISIVTSQAISDQGSQTLLSALKYTAGVTNSGDDTRGDFNYTRGFWAVNYLDGLKREFGFVYLPRSEVYALDRVDVLLGPSAVLYGAGSSGGLVNMESKRPQFNFGGEATASYGTFNRKQAQFDVTGPISDTLAFRFTALYRDSDMLLRYQPDDRRLIQAGLTWQPNEDTNVTAIGFWQHDLTGPVAYMPLAATLYANADQPRMDRRTMLGEPDYNHGPKDDKWFEVLVTHNFSDAIKFHSSSRVEGDQTVYHEINGVYYYNPTDPFIDGNSVIPRSLFGLKAHYSSFDSDNNVEANFTTGPIVHKVLAGVDYSHFRQLSEQAYQEATPLDIYNPVYGTPNDPIWAPEVRQVLNSVGVYGQDQMRILDRASLVFGVRHDHVKAENTDTPDEIDNATTYRAALTVDVTKHLAPFISYSENFQPVSGLSQFGSHYKPLSAKQEEGGVKWEPAPGAMIRVAYYHITEDNHLVADPNNPLNSIQSGSVTSKGAELQANYNVARDLTLSFAYAHNGTKVSGQNHQQDETPENTGSIFATKTVKLPAGATLRVGGGVRYVGPQVAGDPTVFQVVTPHYTLVDGLAAIDVQKWTLQLNIVNLLNKYYYAACDEYGSCENGDPRTVNAAVTYHF